MGSVAQAGATEGGQCLQSSCSGWQGRRQRCLQSCAQADWLYQAAASGVLGAGRAAQNSYIPHVSAHGSASQFLLSMDAQESV